ALVVAEEHLLHGGLGSQVAMVLAQEHPAPVAFVGLEGYAQSGKGDELLARYGLTADHIQSAVKAVLARK
ncbi:MAG: transketolase C-terminal domain-containing protein, partial [Chloroflexota bacterium]